MRTKLLFVFVAALALTALLLAGGASAQRQGNDNASGGAKSKRVVGVRSSDTGTGSRVSITADDTLKDYSAYRSGDRFYVVLPKAAAGARGGGSGRGYSDMQVQQRGDSVVLSYRVAPGAKPRVEQKFNRLDVVFDVPGGGAQQPAAQQPQQQQPQQQTPPAENRNAQPNEQRQSATTQPAPTPSNERRQPTPEEAARAAQAANPAAVNNVPSAVPPGQTQTGTETAAQNPAQASTEPTQEPSPAATPTTEIAQAQPPAPIAPITTNKPATAPQTGVSFGAFLIQNWAVIFAVLAIVGLGLIFVTRRTSAPQPPPVEGLSESPKPTRAKEETAKALVDATAAAQASTVARAEPVSVSDASVADVKPVVVTAAVARSKKQSKKEARQEAKRKKKGARVEEPASAEVIAAESTVAEPVVQEPVVEEPAVEEQTVAAPVAEETAAVEPVAEETLVHEEPAVETPSVEQTLVAEEATVDESALVETPAVEEPVREEPAEVAQAVTTEEVAEPEPAEQVVAPAVETAAPEPFVAEEPAPVAEIEPAFAPEPERVLSEAQNLLEGGPYDRAVVGSRDAMTRQMVAAELLAALASRNVQRRERAGAAFVEHGYFEETARDLREADAPAERSAAARSLAILGDRKATPLLVAALEDPVMDVRRAAVEALSALRDPSAIGPLEALLEREKNERNRIPPRVIRTAVEFCQEEVEQAPVAETQPAAPSVETTEPALSFEPEPVVEQRDEAATVEIAPVEETTVEETFVETAPEPALEELAAPEVAEETAVEETSVSITPFVEEEAAPESLIAPEPAAEATGEPAHVPEPVHAEESSEPVSETAVEPFVEREQTLFETEPETAAAFEEPAAREEVGIEPVVGQWFDFDLGEIGEESRPAARENEATPAPSVAEPVIETSSGEALAPPAIEEVEETAEQPAPVAETHVEPFVETRPEPVAESHAEPAREIEVTSETAEPAPSVREPEPFAQRPAHAAYDKGLAPFDESSTVPASIQQRIASTDPRERAAAIIELSHVDTDEAFQQICAGFDDRSVDVRAAAARALYELRTDRAESFTRALREATPERRREIGASIAESGLAAESISQLTGESRERTYEAFSLLFLMAKAGEVQPLLRAIESHPNNEVRLAVVKLLALSGQKEVLPAFRRLAVRGSLPTEVRSAVMEAIYQISSSQPTPA